MSATAACSTSGHGERQRDRMADRERGHDPERIARVAPAVDGRERDEKQDVIHRLDVDDVAEAELDERRERRSSCVLHCAVGIRERTAIARGVSGAAADPACPAPAPSPSRAALRRRVPVCAATTRADRRRRRRGASSSLRESSRYTVADVPVVVEQEQTPRAMIRARAASTRRRRARARSRRALRGVADRGVGVAQNAERRGIESRRDRPRRRT